VRVLYIGPKTARAVMDPRRPVLGGATAFLLLTVWHSTAPLTPASDPFHHPVPAPSRPVPSGQRSARGAVPRSPAMAARYPSPRPPSSTTSTPPGSPSTRTRRPTRPSTPSNPRTLFGF